MRRNSTDGLEGAEAEVPEVGGGQVLQADEGEVRDHPEPHLVRLHAVELRNVSIDHVLMGACT